jgi:signal transduction histidine kinase/CheY-like chemotaxis protein
MNISKKPLLDTLQNNILSPFGYFGYIDEDNNLVCPSMTRDIWEKCEIENKDIIFPYNMWAEMWGDSLNEGKTYYSNTSLNPSSGHITLERAVLVPILFRQRVIGQIALANKPEDYSEEDINTLNAIAAFLAPVLNARLERDRALKKEREARRHAEENNELKSAFLASMSHEIRTPLNAILGFQDIILDNAGLEEEYRYYLEQATNSGHILLQLINDILDLSKIEAEEMELQDVPFALSSVFKTVYSIARMLIKKSGKDISLKAAIPSKTDVFLQGDPHRLEQILINLITNAIKYTDKGFVEYGVYFEGKKTVHLYVRDTGPGIQKEKQELIFEAFRQADIKRDTKKGGTGLGLSISQRLAEMMGGSITLQSTPGDGATFSVIIPYREAPPQKSGEESVQPTQLETQLETDGTILVVDDNRINRLVVETMLRKEGYKVAAVNDGSEVLPFLEKNSRINLILMDMYMPQMDGITATRSIREYERKKNKPAVPIIALTAAGTSEDARTMQEAGSNGFHSKPIDKPKLLHQIKDLLH